LGDVDPASADIALKYGAIALVAVGAGLDLRSRRIPNALTLGGAVAGLAANVMVHQVPGALTSVSGWAAGVALLAIPFALGGMGAGDVKLLALAGAWGGPEFALHTMLFGAVVGGMIAVGVLIVHGSLGEVMRPAFLAVRMHLGLAIGALWPRSLASAELALPEPVTSASRTHGRLRFPYGPALALGGLVALLVR
jgi:prepilin peptidase CpaA